MLIIPYAVDTSSASSIHTTPFLHDLILTDWTTYEPDVFMVIDRIHIVCINVIIIIFVICFGIFLGYIWINR